jgi:hypothetical protein
MGPKFSAKTFSITVCWINSSRDRRRYSKKDFFGHLSRTEPSPVRGILSFVMSFIRAFFRTISLLDGSHIVTRRLSIPYNGMPP